MVKSEMLSKGVLISFFFKPRALVLNSNLSAVFDMAKKLVARAVIFTLLRDIFTSEPWMKLGFFPIFFIVSSDIPSAHRQNLLIPV
jgi:hypothetical protein